MDCEEGGEEEEERQCPPGESAHGELDEERLCPLQESRKLDVILDKKMSK